MNTEEFYKLPKSLAMSDGYISKKTGEAVKLSASAKIIYTYMLCKTEFFTETMKGQHYETQKTIAKQCGIEEKAAGAILRTFMEHEVLEGKKLRPNGEGQWRWHYYKVHSDVVLWEGTTEKFELIEEGQSKPKVQEKTKQQYQPKQQQPAWASPSYDPFDESDLPF